MVTVHFGASFATHTSQKSLGKNASMLTMEIHGKIPTLICVMIPMCSPTMRSMPTIRAPVFQKGSTSNSGQKNSTNMLACVANLITEVN